MGRGCCSEMVLQRKGPWTAEEDELLLNYIHTHGEGLWKSLPQRAGLLRCGKSCRLRWMNYLRPNIRRGNITPDEDEIIIRMHMLLGNRWSLIACRLPGRTDNEIKNYWNAHLSKRVKFQGIFPIGSPQQLLFRLHKNHPDNAASNKKGHINNKNLANANHESTERLIFLLLNRFRSLLLVQELKFSPPKPIRATASFSSTHFMTDSHADNITSDIGNANNNSCNGCGENCKLIEEEHTWLNKFFDNEGFVEEKNDHCYEICTDGRLGIDDGCWQVPYEGSTANLVNNGPRTLEMVYEEYLQLLKTEDDMTDLVDSSYSWILNLYNV